MRGIWKVRLRRARRRRRWSAEADDPVRACGRRRRMSARDPPDRDRRAAARASRAGRRRRRLLGDRRRRSRSARARWIGPHVVIDGRTRIGRDNRIFHFASIGARAAGQEVRRRGHRGRDRRRQHHPRVRAPSTAAPRRTRGVTRVGNDNWIMAYVHLAHDCQIGSHTIFANCTPARRPRARRRLGDPRRLHRACTSSCASARTRSPAWAPTCRRTCRPTSRAAGNLAQPYGINTEGLKRRGFTRGDHRRAQARLQDALPQRPRPGGGEARARGAGRRLRRRCALPRFPRQQQARHRPLVSRRSARVGMVAGEASGDLLGAPPDRARSRRAAAGMQFAGIGGPRMIGAGLRVALSRWRSSRCAATPRCCGTTARSSASAGAWRSALLAERPDLFIGVDSSDFNLDLERQLKDAGIPTIHYVSPSIWAWRGWRMRAHRALGRPHAGDVSVRGAALREGRRPGDLRRPPARRRDSDRARQGRGARRSCACRPAS